MDTTIKHSPFTLPLFATTVHAGFPSPAHDYLETMLDLNQLLIKHPSATFFVRVQGNSMTLAGIHSGDILIVDRSLESRSNTIVVAVINGEFAVKRLHRRDDLVTLMAECSPEHGHYPPITMNEESDCQVWGVVVAAIHLF